MSTKPKEHPEHSDFRERLVLIMDTCDNGLAAASMPVSAEIHVVGLKGVLENIKKIALEGTP